MKQTITVMTLIRNMMLPTDASTTWPVFESEFEGENC